MTEPNMTAAMALLAVATPLLALLLHLAVRRGAISGLKRSRILLLAMIGPANLAIHVAYDRLLDRPGAGSIPGIALAAAVFLAVGFGMGLLRPSRRSIKDEG